MEQHDTSPNPQQQHKQAGRFLLKLQWVLLVVLTMAVCWLYNNQQNFQQKMLVLQNSNEQEIARLRDIDDKLYAIGKQDKDNLTEKQPAIKSEQNNADIAENQLNLLRIQLQTADKMLVDGHYLDIITLLESIQWQLAQDNNKISPSLTTVLQENINKDIERLQAHKNQPSPWQLQNLAINDIQRFLRSRTSSQLTFTHTQLNQPLNQYDAMVYEIIMTLNLAEQASSLRQQDMMVMYLQQAKKQLAPIQHHQQVGLNSNIATLDMDVDKVGDTDTKSTSKSLLSEQVIKNTDKQKIPDTDKKLPDLNTLDDVMVWLDDLITNVPKPIRLTTMQILDDTKGAKDKL